MWVVWLSRYCLDSRAFSAAVARLVPAVRPSYHPGLVVGSRYSPAL